MQKKSNCFSKCQICSAATKFKAALTDSDYDECPALEDDAGNDDVDDDNNNYNSTGKCSDDKISNNYNNVPSLRNNVVVLGEESPHCDTFPWKFLVEISQSTFDR